MVLKEGHEKQRGLASLGINHSVRTEHYVGPVDHGLGDRVACHPCCFLPATPLLDVLSRVVIGRCIGVTPNTPRGLAGP